MTATSHVLLINSPAGALQARSGELILLTGASGSGKSLWLQRLAGLCPPPRNCSLTIDGKPCTESAPNGVRMLFDRHPPIWLGQHVAEELSFGLPERPSMDALTESLTRWGIPEVSLNSEPEKLTRRQGLRLCLAAMDMAKPALVLLDNPTASLSASDAEAICDDVVRWSRSSNLVVVVACNRWQDWQAAATQTWRISAPDEVPQLGDNFV